MRFLVPQTEAEARHRLDVLERAADRPGRPGAGRLRPARRAVLVRRLAAHHAGRAARPFPGRPPRGDVPVPAPGVLVPDCPVTVPGRPDVVRLRQLAREGVTVLRRGRRRRRRRCRSAGRRTCRSPVHRIARPRRRPTLREALGARPDEIWVLRPDAHVAAVLTRAADVAPAVARLLARARPQPRPGLTHRDQEALAMAFYRQVGERPAEAAHPVPPPRRRRSTPRS